MELPSADYFFLIGGWGSCIILLTAFASLKFISKPNKIEVGVWRFVWGRGTWGTSGVLVLIFCWGGGLIIFSLFVGGGLEPPPLPPWTKQIYRIGLADKARLHKHSLVVFLERYFLLNDAPRTPLRFSMASASLFPRLSSLFVAFLNFVTAQSLHKI